MVFAPTTDSRRLAGWNGLQFSHPVDWEVIVAGPRHLLIEHNLSPILEIRWEPGGKSSSEQVIQAATSRLAEKKRTVQKIAPPALFQSLELGDLSGLSWHADHALDGLIWQCPACATVLFVHLHRQTEPTAVGLLLQSLRCHQAALEDGLWSIQDFRLTLPPEFTFVDHTFAAGLSRLAFAGRDLRLQFCRLAPATDRLTRNTLGELLTSMLGNRDRTELLTDSPTLCEIRTNPTAARRLVARLGRKPVFQWGRIWHKQQQNRLLTLIVESNRPLHPANGDHLAQRYEIV
jgi:hypothetical protein